MNIDTLLSRLEKVRSTGHDNWLACCPAHDDKSPSLTIALRDDRILLHCFAGCAAIDVIGAIGLEFDELFEKKLSDRMKPVRRPFPAADVLEALARETMITYICACDMAAGKTLPVFEKERLKLAAERIMEGSNLANGEC